MNRLQRKFLMVSAALHGLLLVVLLVGPAFAPKRRPPPKDLPILRVIPSHLVDAPFFNEEGAQATAPTPVQPEAEPPPARAEPQTPPREQRTQPKTVEKLTPPSQPPPVQAPPQANRPSTPTSKPKTAAEPKPKISIKVDPTLITRKPDETRRESEAKAEREREVARERKRQAAAQALRESVKNAVQGIEKSVSGKTDVQLSGSGGAAYADYRQVVQTLYDRAWIAPQDVQDSQATVQVEVTIHRTGKVVRDRILKASGIRSLDLSVEDALYRVRAGGLPPFPQEAQDRGDLERVFRINFNLSSRLLQG